MSTSVARVLADEERAALQQRVLRALTVGQIVGAAALGAAVTVGAFVVQEILGDETAWGGIATATFTLGAAVMSQSLSRLMRRRGRRPGLVLGYSLAAAGALVAGLGAEQGWLPIFLLGLFLFGNGQASNLLARYAAADLAEPDHRSRAMAHVVFASTFGAVLGPILVVPAERAGEVWLDLGRYTGPWLFSGLLCLLAVLNTAVRLRPDPLVVAGGLVTAAEDARSGVPLRDALRVVAANPRALLAIVAMATAHSAMVAVMTMTPVHMKLHGHESLSQLVISTHIAGMFAFSPLVGAHADRRGRVSAILVGATILFGATVLAAGAGGIEALLFPALWGLGLGWSFCFIGGSSLLTESVPAEERVAVQGTADLMMSACGGLAGFSSGFIREAFGYHMLANLAAMSAAALVAVAYLSHQRATRLAVAD